MTAWTTETPTERLANELTTVRAELELMEDELWHAGAENALLRAALDAGRVLAAIVGSIQPALGISAQLRAIEQASAATKGTP